ncbi:MAG: extracellular solute-binding protein [Casimicrobiaceae bacterium]
MKTRLIALAAALLAIALAPGQTMAADAASPQLSVADMAAYQGPDRQQRLLAAAKKEGGELMVYHVYPNLPAVMNAYTSKYGIKVKAWRSGSEGVLQRITNESRGNRFEVDVVQNNAPENEAAHREKLLQEVRSPYYADLVAAAVPSHKEWVGITLDVFVAAYNTTKVKKEELPKSYKDLLDPKWKGRLGVEVDDYHWFATLAANMGEKETNKLFSDIIAANGMSVRKGHSLLTNLVASGEVPLGLTIYSWTPEQLKKKGAPIEIHPIAPVIAQFSTIAVTKKAPHPYSALLFHDFMLTEGQQLLADLNYVPTSKKIETPVSKLQLKYIDPEAALDNNEKWIKTYEEVVTKPGK